MSLLSPQLEAFVAVAQHKSVHGAAAMLHLTQTAVTQRIRALETKLRTTLFIRTRRGMMVTPEGEALLRYCTATREIEGEALAKITGAAKDTSVRICISGPTSIMSARIIPQCLPVLKKFPNLLVQFDIDDTDSENRVKVLRSGDCQLAILPKDDVTPEMEHKILRPERYVLVCTPAWKRRKLRDIIQSERVLDYDPSDTMTSNYLKHFRLFSRARHDRHYVNRTDVLATMLTAGCGYSVLTAEFSKPYIENGDLIVLNAGKMYENIMALAWYARPEPPAYFSALLNVIM